MNYEKIIHAIIDPIVEDKDSIMIRELPSESEKDITILIVAEKEDTSRLIGRKGIVANAIREVISVGGKSENKRVHVHFESFDEEGKKEE
ncbi:MAG: KH domain-containing protein [Erysipelotrichaceae bacterium]|nr:KH domain-containing protein [Erysipelotrichaceae bacterium]